LFLRVGVVFRGAEHHGQRAHGPYRGIGFPVALALRANVGHVIIGDRAEALTISNRGAGHIKTGESRNR
jgi:hypothetical protein